MNKEALRKKHTLTGITTPGMILVSVCAFFLLTWGSLLITSQENYLDDFFTRFISGDLLVTHKDTMSPGDFILRERPFIPGTLHPIEDYDALQRIVSADTSIDAYTPYGLFQGEVMNQEKRHVTIVIIVFDAASFPFVFPSIIFSTGKNTTKKSNRGFYLPLSLINDLDELYTYPPAIGDFLIITDKKGSITAAREIPLSGGVYYGDFTHILPRVGYADYTALGPEIPGRKMRIPAGELKEQTLGEDKDFFKNITVSTPLIEKKALSDSYFFEFFTYSPGDDKETPPPAPVWHYFALSCSRGTEVKKVKQRLAEQLDKENMPLRILSPVDIARPFSQSLSFITMTFYFITLVFFIILLIIVIIKTRARKKEIKQKAQEYSHTRFKKDILTFILSIAAGSIAGIGLGIFLVLIINKAHIPLPMDSIDVIKNGGHVLSIKLSALPLIINSLLVFLWTGCGALSPFFLLKGVLSRDGGVDSKKGEIK